MHSVQKRIVFVVCVGKHEAASLFLETLVGTRCRENEAEVSGSTSKSALMSSLLSSVTFLVLAETAVAIVRTVFTAKSEILPTGAASADRRHG